MFELSEHMRGNNVDPVTVKRVQKRSGDQLTEQISGCSVVLTELSREMRTQMNAIVAFSFMMNKKEYGEPEKEEFSNHIYNSCEQIISLFDNFLDSAIIDTGNSKQEPGVFNPDSLFDDLFSEFREIMKKERYKDILLLSGKTDHKSPDYIFDANRVTRVIRNLFNIALSNTKSGCIKASYNITGGQLLFRITDSGQSFRKLREFIQSNDISDSLSKYADIHMAASINLTRKLIRMMEGSVWIESNGMKGSSVCFSVPLITVSDHNNQINKFSSTMSAT